MVLDFLAIHPMPIAEQASAATPKGSAGKPRSNEWPAEVATPLLDVAKLPLDASSLADTTMQDCNEHLEAVPEGCVVKNKFLGPSGGPQQDVMLLPGLPTGAQTVTPRSLSAPVANMQTHCDDPDCLTVLRTSILEEAGAATPQGSAGELQPNEWPAEVATSRWDVRRQLLDAAPPTSAHDTQDSGEHEFRVVAQRSDTGVPPLILTGTTTPEAGAGESAGEAAVGKAGQAAGGESRSAECGPCRYAWKPGDYRNSNDLEYEPDEGGHGEPPEILWVLRSGVPALGRGPEGDAGPAQEDSPPRHRREDAETRERGVPALRLLLPENRRLPERGWM